MAKKQNVSQENAAAEDAPVETNSTASLAGTLTAQIKALQAQKKTAKHLDKFIGVIAGLDAWGITAVETALAHRRQTLAENLSKGSEG